jgi:murein DD-endopeptidase MepM/ murein hydrolase activator NlpD
MRIVLLVGCIFLMGFMNSVADWQAEEVRRYEFEIAMTETERNDIAEDLEETEALYADKLMDIVTIVYEREFYSMGGYETPDGAGVTEIYEAILNEVQDYGSMLQVVDTYFDARREYLTDIPSVWPIEYDSLTRITSGFGWRVSPLTGNVVFHNGIDIAGVWNAKVIAPADGVVMEHWLTPGWHWGTYYHGHRTLGGMIRILHDGGFMTIYGHLSRTDVHEGQIVKRGDVIGVIGDTGQANGRHLHYELSRYLEPVNPIDYLQF